MVCSSKKSKFAVKNTWMAANLTWMAANHTWFAVKNTWIVANNALELAKVKDEAAFDEINEALFDANRIWCSAKFAWVVANRLMQSEMNIYPEEPGMAKLPQVIWGEGFASLNDDIGINPAVGPINNICGNIVKITRRW